MLSEPSEKIRERHIGHNVQRIRIYLGIKQDALAADMGLNQQTVSRLEQQEQIEEPMLTKIAEALGVSPELIEQFDTEKAVYNISNYQEATISEGATTNAIFQQFNPVEKIVELYERLLQSEREKIELLMNRKKQD